MGETLASGFLRYLTPRPDIVVVEKREDRAQELRELHGVSIADAPAAVEGADVVVLAVKPQDVGSLLDSLGDLIAPGTLVLSIAAGIRSSFIEERLQAGVSVVRSMPNTPARIDRSTTGVSAGASCTAEALALAVRLLESVGAVVEVPEALQDAVTAVSGSGPAYVFYLAEAMIAAGVDLGLDEETARRMVHHTILGAALLLDVSGEKAEELRHKVTSPHGTTAAAISTLEQLQVRQSVIAAVAAARDRSRELSGG